MWEALPGFAAQRGCPISVPPSPVVLFTLISSASKARSGSCLFISVWRAQAVKSTIIFLLLCQYLQQAGKKETLKGLSDLNQVTHPSSSPGAADFFQSFKGLDLLPSPAPTRSILLTAGPREGPVHVPPGV